MTLLQQKATGTNGSTVTTAGGTGDAFASIPTGTGGAWTYDTTPGSIAGWYKHTTSTSAGYLSWTGLGTANFRTSFWFMYSTQLASQYMQVRTAAGQALGWSIQGASFKSGCVDSAGSPVLASQSTSGLTANTAYRVTVEATSNATTGTITVSYYNAAGTLIETKTASGVNTRGGNFTEVRFGQVAATAATTVWVGNPRAGDDSLTELGDITSNLPPSANAGPDQTVPPFNITTGAPTVVTFSGSGSTDPDGTIASYSWSVPGLSLSSTTVANPTATVTPSLSDQTFTATLTVTDNLGATDTDTMTLVAKAAEQARLNSAGTWRPARIVAL